MIQLSSIRYFSEKGLLTVAENLDMITAHSTQHTAHSTSCPLISIIVPVYNVEQYLVRCIDSILHQTYTNLEVILVDDGSTDNCPSICDSYSIKDERIKVIHKQNGGLSSARNVGLDAANGEYIGFIDSDDFILPEMYEVLFRLIKDSNADIGLCSFQRVDEEGNPLHGDDDIFEPEVLSGGEALTAFMTKQWRYVIVWNKLYEASIFLNIRFPEGRLHEDEFVVHHVLNKCRRIASTSTAMYMYTQRSNSIMGKIKDEAFTPKRCDDVLSALLDKYRFFCSIGRKDLADISAVQTYSFLNGMLGHISYLKNMKLFNRYIFISVGLIFRSAGIKAKLRPIKLFASMMINIARSFWHLGKKWGGEVGQRSAEFFPQITETQVHHKG